MEKQKNEDVEYMGDAGMQRHYAKLESKRLL